MHHAENCRGRANAQRNRHDGNGGKGRGVRELPQGEADIIATLEQPSHPCTSLTSSRYRPLDGSALGMVCARTVTIQEDVSVIARECVGCALLVVHWPRAYPAPLCARERDRGPCCSATPASPPPRASLRRRVQDGPGCIRSAPRRRSRARTPTGAPRGTALAGL